MSCDRDCVETPWDLTSRLRGTFSQSSLLQSSELILYAGLVLTYEKCVILFYFLQKLQKTNYIRKHKLSNYSLMGSALFVQNCIKNRRKDLTLFKSDIRLKAFTQRLVQKSHINEVLLSISIYSNPKYGLL